MMLKGFWTKMWMGSCKKKALSGPNKKQDIKARVQKL